MNDVHLVMTPLVSQIRIYDQPNGYDLRIPYVGIITITHITDKKVYISGTVGTIDRNTYRAISDLLKSQGIEEVFYERRGAFVNKETLE